MIFERNKARFIDELCDNDVHDDFDTMSTPVNDSVI
jgi:hypothetical protein